MELKPREHHQWSTDDGLATLCGAEDERYNVDRGTRCCRQIKSATIEETGWQRRGKGNGEKHHGGQRWLGNKR
ncbi:hypothetical protein DVH24_026431 [Malus domestica]|uniref:Uncharacterized protein n=1 Tax=Malus domestica TaxID=3750 RepID=A0A498KNM6_MALDO|nr:hypothetical protein DVH24_026431 [Malus domestica]